MIWTRTTPDVVLARIITRLTDPNAKTPGGNDASTGLTRDTCWIGKRPQEPYPAPADIYATVHLQGGKFDQGMFDGGAGRMAVVDGSLVVSMRSGVQLDDYGRAQAALTDSEVGLYLSLTKILLNLAGHDLLDDSGNRLLCEPLFPADFDIPEDIRTISEVSVALVCKFAWDLR